MQDLLLTIELAKGIKVQVADIVETDLDIANGTHDVIVDIIIRPDEPQIPDELIVHLKYVPSYILVKLDRSAHKAFQTSWTRRICPLRGAAYYIYANPGRNARW